MNGLITQWIVQPDRYGIEVHTLEHTSPPNETVFSFSGSFRIDAIVARGQDDFYLAGTARNGDFVIENWRIEAQEGSIRTVLTSPVQPVGEPSPPAVFATTYAGGTYIPGEERSSVTPRAERIEILRGPQVPVIRDNTWGVDPEGRFLLFVSTDDVLYRIDLLPEPQPPVAIHDAASLWTLPHVEGSMGRCQFPGGSRVWEIGLEQSLPDPEVAGNIEIFATLLFDAENDGVFEQVQAVRSFVELEPTGFWDGIETDFAFIWPDP